MVIARCGYRDTRVPDPHAPPMIIAICGSLTFFKNLRDLQKQLKSLGHIALLPKGIRLLETGKHQKSQTIAERLKAEAKYDFIREHFRKIEKADTVLVANYDKKGIKGYIGGNTFLEMGIAFYLGKKIYLLYPIPEMEYSKLEMHAMQPVVVYGDVTKII